MVMAVSVVRPAMAASVVRVPRVLRAKMQVRQAIPVQPVVSAAMAVRAVPVVSVA
jgi:hypothetical protein